ncbi:MAG: beta strand repeat-containing protein [Patescibacteria group bacterium]
MLAVRNKKILLALTLSLLAGFSGSQALAVGLQVGTSTLSLGSSENIFYGLVNASSNAASNFLKFEKGAGNSIFQVGTNGNVGIGVAVPNNTIQVNSLINFNNTDLNTLLGYQSGKNLVVGAQYNTLVGYQAGLSTNDGVSDVNADHNTAFGYQALYQNLSGSKNTAIGRDAIRQNGTGVDNSVLGYGALYYNYSGSNNVAIGREAGYISTVYTQNGTQNQSVIIGAGTKTLASGGTNEIIVGYGANGLGSNSVVLGNDSIAKTILKGKVGIGSTTPASATFVIGTSDTNYSFDAGNYRIGSIGTPIFNADAVNKAYVDSAAASSSFWTANGTAIFNNNSGSVGIGTNIPQSKLEVIDAKVGNFLSNIITRDSNAMGLGVGGSIAFLGNYTAGGANTTGAAIDAYKETATSGEYDFALRFHTRTDTADPGLVQERMRITSGGNVGIGITNPSYPFDVYSAAAKSQAVFHGYSVVGSYADDFSGSLRIGTNGAYYGLLDFNSYNSTLTLKSGDGFSGSKINFDFGSKHVISLVYPDKIGVGTTSPTTATLVIATSTTSYSFDAGNYRIGGVGTPVFNTDAVNMAYVASAVGSSSLWTASGTSIFSNNAGNVGVGTNNPIFKFHVKTGNDKNFFVVDTQDVPYSVAIGAMNDANTNTIPLEIIGSKVIMGMTGGKVGIGTADPMYNLHVYGESSGGVISSTQNFSDQGSATVVARAGGLAGLENASSTSLYMQAIGEYTDINGLGQGSVNLIGSSNNIFSIQSEQSDMRFVTKRVPFAVERMRITFNGLIGIGTSSPTTAALVIGTSTTNYSLDAGNYRLGSVGTPVSDTDAVNKAYLVSALASSGTWTASGTSIFNNNSGNVGIGINNPASLLTVSAPQGTTSIFDIRYWGSSIFKIDYGTFLFGREPGGSIGTNNPVIFGNNTTYSMNSSPFFLINPKSDNTGNLFEVRNGVNPKFVVSNTGDVSIGTSTTSYKLDVNGDLRVSGGAYFDGGTFVKDQSGAPDSWWGWYAWEKEFQFNKRSSANAFIQNIFTADWDTGNFILVPSGGKVGVGSTSPTTATLVISTSTTNYSLYAGNYRIGGVGTPVLNSDAATKSYVDSVVASSSGSGAFGADINLGGNNILNVNKLTVSTIDPLYNINGINYSSFAASIVGGVKEEYSGRTRVASLVKNSDGTIEYEKVFDFDKLSEGSDLWVWHQTIDFNNDNVEVVATPSGTKASIYYIIDGSKLIFRSDRRADISYRLTGRRFDWRSWPTRAINQQEKPSFILNFK